MHFIGQTNTLFYPPNASSDKLTAFYFAAPAPINLYGKTCSQVTLERRELVHFSDAIRAH